MIDSTAIAEELKRQQTVAIPKTEDMLTATEQAGEAYTQTIEQNATDPYAEGQVEYIFRKAGICRGYFENLCIPQFFRKVPESLFFNDMVELLDCEQLSDGFTLKGKAYDIDFTAADDKIRKVDVKESEGGKPKAFKMGKADQRIFKEYFNFLLPERGGVGSTRGKSSPFSTRWIR